MKLNESIMLLNRKLWLCICVWENLCCPSNSGLPTHRAPPSSQPQPCFWFALFSFFRYHTIHTAVNICICFTTINHHLPPDGLGAAAVHRAGAAAPPAPFQPEPFCASMAGQTPNSQAPLQHSCPSALAQHTEQLRPLTSARRRFARRAGGQLSDGGTDCLCGMSWGLYSLSFVSLVRSGFCRHCRDTIGNRIASLLPPLLLGALC